MDEQSGKSKEAVMSEGMGESEMRELVPECS